MEMHSSSKANPEDDSSISTDLSTEIIGDIERCKVDLDTLLQHLRKLQERRLSSTTVAGSVTLVDATGYRHPMSVHFCASYQQLKKTLQVLFERDASQARIQKEYMRKEEYDLCIDNGEQVTLLTSDNWPTIGPDAEILMRIIIRERTDLTCDADYSCYFCGTVNGLGVNSVKYESQDQTVRSTYCKSPGCNRRFQITRRLEIYPPEQQTISNSELQIRNFHVLQICYSSAEMRDLVFLACQATLMVPRPCPALREKEEECAISCFLLVR